MEKEVKKLEKFYKGFVPKRAFPDPKTVHLLVFLVFMRTYEGQTLGSFCKTIKQ